MVTSLIVALLIIGVIWWLVRAYTTLPNQPVDVIAVIALILVLLRAFGLGV